jgi:hypothetical protein
MHALFSTRSFELEDLSYDLPLYIVPNRQFDAIVQTKVFSSLKQKLLDVAASASLEIGIYMISGQAEMSMHYSKSDDKRVVYSNSDLNVEMYSLHAGRITFDDIDPLLVVCQHHCCKCCQDLEELTYIFANYDCDLQQTEFDALPNLWDADPAAYYAFIARWGTHFVV